MKRHSIFPTLVCEWENPDKDKFKKIFFEQALRYFDSDGYSHEVTGMVDLHLNPAFDDFYNSIGMNAKAYLACLGLDPNIFNINLVKSWLNVTREMHTSTHSHADAHISWAYYVNIPQGIEKPIMFTVAERPNDLFHNMSYENIKEPNIFNTNAYAINPVEGLLLMFPAKLQHSTGGYGSGRKDEGVKTLEDLSMRKVCIAGDFLLTYKNKSARSYGLQPTSNWKVF